MPNKIQFKRGPKASLPSLDAGEPGYCTDTQELYIGNSSGTNTGIASKADYAQMIQARNGLSANAIINGNMDVWQRGTSFALPIGGRYTADRYFARRAGGTLTGATVSRQTGDQSRYCIRVQRDNGNADLNYAWLSQLVETANTIPLRGKVISLSFRARKGAGYSRTGSVLKVNVKTGTAADGTFSDSYGSIAGSANVVDDIATLTTDFQTFRFTSSAISNLANILQLYFEVGPFVGAASASDYVEIEQIQIHVGSTALPFQPRLFSEELALCQRYYEKSYPLGVNPGTASGDQGIYINIGSPATATLVAKAQMFTVRKRTTPTVTVYDNTGATGVLSSWNGSVTANGVTATLSSLTENKFKVQSVVPSGVYEVFGHYAADAEM